MPKLLSHLRITTYHTYTEAITQLDEIKQSCEAIVAEAAEKDNMVSRIKEALNEQEPEVITYVVPVKKKTST